MKWEQPTPNDNRYLKSSPTYLLPFSAASCSKFRLFLFATAVAVAMTALIKGISHRHIKKYINNWKTKPTAAAAEAAAALPNVSCCCY